MFKKLNDQLNFMVLSSSFQKYEPLVYNLFIFLNLLPLFLFRYFPTLDGPAHLYNSQIILSLLTQSSENIDCFFSLNSEVIPNWTSHFILTALNSILPAYLAEKILLLIYFISFPIIFRKIIVSESSENALISYLIFPFLYSSFIFLGFYNFCIAIVLLLFSLYHLLKSDGNISIGNISILVLLQILLYFSHIFIFVLFVFFALVHFVVKFFIAIQQNEKILKVAFRDFNISVLILVTTGILPFVFALQFFIQRPPAVNLMYLSSQELLSMLFYIKPLLVFLHDIEDPYHIILFLSYLLLTCIIAINSIKLFVSSFYKTEKISIRMRFQKLSEMSLYWFLITILILILFLTYPDSDNNGSYISSRFALLFFIFLILWISTQKLPKWAILISVLFSISCQLFLLKYYTHIIKNLNKMVISIEEASIEIPEHSVVFPLNMQTNWITSHFSNYLAVEKNIVLLENYELATKYFPVEWDSSFVHDEYVPVNQYPDDFKLKWKNEILCPLEIGYFVILGHDNEPPASLKKIEDKLFNNKFDLIYTNRDCKIFKNQKSAN